EYSVDVCYRGQSFALNLPWADATILAAAFHTAHEQRYGHRLDLPLELVNLRVALDVATPAPAIAAPAPPATPPRRHADGAVFARAALVPGTRIDGPAVVYDAIATAFIDDGWSARADAAGNLQLARNPPTEGGS
ncbi:MAG: hydantoinase/oxoprolinase family protein, partial [Gammaproteobacteria bacterium]